MEPGQPASWQPDPTARHELRYWDGAAWTDSVSDAGVTTNDPFAPDGTEAPEAPGEPSRPYSPAIRAFAPESLAEGGPPTTNESVLATVVAAAIAVLAVVVVVLILTAL
ncbi:MAG: DUF2510 domain-containing protein [Acidimicrobiales bacterium]